MFFQSKEDLEFMFGLTFHPFGHQIVLKSDVTPFLISYSEHKVLWHSDFKIRQYCSSSMDLRNLPKAI